MQSRKRKPRMSANSTTNALGHDAGSATTGMRLHDNLSHVIESANLTLLSGHSLNICQELTSSNLLLEQP